MQSTSPIVILSDSLEGGAAVATNHLVDALWQMEKPVERWHFSSGKRTGAENELSLDPHPKRPPFERLLKNFSKPGADKLRTKRHESALESKVRTRQPKLINLHNIHDAGLTHNALRRLPRSTRLVWTLHDLWPFKTNAFRWRDSTLNRWETACPDLGTNAQSNREAFFRERPDTVLIAPSRWMQKEAAAVVPKNIAIHHVPYGVDSEAFHPSPRDASRAEWKCDDSIVWLGFGSTWASSRKGADLVLSLLQRFPLPSIGLIVWGEASAMDWPDSIPTRRLGKISGEARLAAAYSACDLFLCPSRADNLPNAVLESLACGTPVLGSNVGGIPDMVQSGISGWLFEPDSVEALHDALQHALSERQRWAAYRAQCRELAKTKFSLTAQAEAYWALFNTLL